MTEPKKRTIKEELEYELELLVYLLPTYKSEASWAEQKFRASDKKSDLDNFVKATYELSMRLDRIQFITRILANHHE